METAINFEELELIEKAIFLLVYTAVSFVAYLISIKGMYDFFPNIFKALGAFLVEMGINTALSFAMYGITGTSRVDPTNPLIILTLVVTLIVTIIVRKITLNYATEMSPTLLQTINSLVMHFFYIIFIFFVILLLYLYAFDGNFDFGMFRRDT